jgi:trafficking kinesin-binding protein 1
MNFDFLQRKISSLELENRKLHSEVEQVAKETDEIEEQERRLLAELNDQLNSTNVEYECINLELERFKEENRLQNEQIILLTNRLSDTELRLHQILNENEECYATLSVTKENQNMLASELVELKGRYQETLTLLQETQALLREKQKKSQPQSNRSSLYVPNFAIPTHNYGGGESLQTELMESSLFSENSSLDSGINSDHGGSQQKAIPQFQKVFNTVKCASSASIKNEMGDSFASELNLLSSSSQPRMSCSIYSSDSLSKPSSDKLGSFSMYSSIYGGSKSDDAASTESSDDYNSHLRYGLMGCPGAKGKLSLQFM